MATTGRGAARRVTTCVAGLGVALGTTVVVMAPADAAAIVVTSTADSGPGSLRDALAQAEASAADDFISFTPSVSGTIDLTTGELDVAVGGSSGSLTLEGPGSDLLAIDAGRASRVLDVHGPGGDTRPTVVVSGLTLTSGLAGDGGGGAVRATGSDVTLDRLVISDSQGQPNGGGVLSEGGSLLVTSSSITRNSVCCTSADGPEARGGGISFDGGGAVGAFLTVQGSTVSDNTAQSFGGGINALGSAPVTVTGSTVSGNEVAAAVLLAPEAVQQVGTGGGIFAQDLTVADSRIIDNRARIAGGGLSGSAVTVSGSTIARNVTRGSGGGIQVKGADGELGLQSSTVAGNRAVIGGGVDVDGALAVEVTLSTVAANAAVAGGGLFMTTDAALRGTIVAMNTGADLAGEGTFTLNRSLVRDPGAVAYVDSGGSIVGEDPRLGPLSDNGGGTETMVPASNSPVIDRGSSFDATSDQRGSPRPVEGADVGAVELTQAELSTRPRVGNTAQPTISGVVRVGESVHTDGGTWEPAAASLRYQWLRDGVPIAGATAASYTLQRHDFGVSYYGGDNRKRISVQVTAKAQGHQVGVMESANTDHVVKGILRIDGRPRVEGRTGVGSVLRARPRLTAVSPRPRGVLVQWFLDGRSVNRAYGDFRFRLGPRSRGQRVEVSFTYTAPRAYLPLTYVVRKRGSVR